jgi:hypothetical protein
VGPTQPSVQLVSRSFSVGGSGKAAGA